MDYLDSLLVEHGESLFIGIPIRLHVPAIAGFLLFPTVVLWLAYYVVLKHIAKDIRVALSQRLTRAAFAIFLVQGALRSIWDDALTNDYGTDLSKFYGIGVCYFYVYDTLLLAVSGSNDFAMFAHHFASIVCFGVMVCSDRWPLLSSTMLIEEGLVAFGFCLFYLKLTNQTRTGLYQFVCASGLSFILFVRVPIELNSIRLQSTAMWRWAGYKWWGVPLPLMPSSWMDRLPMTHELILTALVCVSIITVALPLEVLWAGLYYKNLKGTWKPEEEKKAQRPVAAKAEMVVPQSSDVRKRTTASQQ